MMRVKPCKSIYSASFLKSQKLKNSSTKPFLQIHLDVHTDTPRCMARYIKVYGQVNRGEYFNPHKTSRLFSLV